MIIYGHLSEAKAEHDLSTNMNKPDLLIKNKIHTIRGVQVMLDSDLAELYGVSTKRLNEQVKRNNDRFPADFMFQLGFDELNLLRSHFATSSTHGGRRYAIYAFTEQGVAMLSSVLRSKKAVEINILIMRAFVEMRRFLVNNAAVFEKFHQIDQKFLQHDENFSKLFDALEKKKLTPNQGIFFNGQVFDAFVFISKLIKTAKSRIVLIDNYVDENTLQLFSDKNSEVSVKICTKNLNQKLLLAKDKFNHQHGGLQITRFGDSHDRFIMIDDEVYHIGANLKDLGKKWFAFSKLAMEAEIILSRL
ncbi:MAG: ORF6N domain-containing protein [Bacteroidales bacterium]|nr:ORF6N domain-containing protein [Bacteroidales bacterium]